MRAGDLKDKLDRIISSAKGIDAIVLANMQEPMIDPNFLYLTGFTSGLFEDSFLVATREKVYLLTSPLEMETARLQKKPGMQLIDATYDKAKLARWMKKLIGGKRIGINEEFLPVSINSMIKKNFRPKAIKGINSAFNAAREIKTHEEIEKIRHAVQITKWTMLKVQKYFKAGMTELELAAQFNYIAMTLGSSGPSFPTLVSFGPNTALPHHLPDNTKLKDGDFIIIDAGVKVQNYCSDLTRTFLFGTHDPMKKEIIDTVRKAQIEAIHAIRPGAIASEIYDIANHHINTAHNGKYKGRFIHKLGHPIGIEVHDMGQHLLAPDVKSRLKAGMVTSVEPGIYINGFGGARIEDDILIADEGAIIL
ncbi:MAG: aminopeptidase P family protein [Candidatus Micrarchaeota archaeon]|nr:aminopeptidase P family protein [Candidatus Micrarchaeota archaeon]